VQMQMKQQAAVAQQVQQMLGGGQQGGQQGGGPGPRPGAQPKAPRPQGPPGMIPRDQIGPASGQPPALRQRG